MTSITLFSNPNSGQNRRNPKKVKKLASILGQAGEIILSSSLEELQKDIDRCRDSGTQIICIHGGDGTIHQTLSAIHRSYQQRDLPKIALLKGGTINNIVTGVGCRKKPEQLLHQIVDRCKTTDLNFTIQRKRYLIIGEDKAGFIFGLGGIPHFLDEYYQGMRGPLGALWLLIKGLFSAIIGGKFASRILQKREMTITIDNNQLPASLFSLAGAATVPILGLQFRPFYKMFDNVPYFQLLALTGSPLRIFFAFPKLFAGKPIVHRSIFDKTGSSLSLAANGTRMYTIDGDLYTFEQNLEITLGREIEFIV